MDNQSIWREILKVNLRFAGAGIAIFYGWLCWQGASKEMWALYGIAILGFLGGGRELIRAMFQAGGVIKSLGRVKQLKEKGEEPKADQKPDNQDLIDHGVIR